MFSSIEENDRDKVIKHCYWPLLEIAEKGFPIGIELTGITLEIIDSIDPKWVKKFKTLLDDNKVELIGSGYAQIISPLIPSEVNNYNQKLGLKSYEKILGIKPEIALINEMAFSSGIIEHYINNGYKAVIMEWNNPKTFNQSWDNQFRYFPQTIFNSENDSTTVIWADSIAFQKFQRFVHGEISIDSYKNYLKNHNNSQSRFFPLYSSDAEIFDFRPGRFKTESTQNFEISEWNKIEDLLCNLSKEEDFNMVLPSKILSENNSQYAFNKLKLESLIQPIPVKKQEKYNINRWALSGRGDLWLNTMCYNLFSHIKLSKNEENWKKLCYFWSSDFRTHITQKRWDDLLKQLDVFKNKIDFKNNKFLIEEILIKEEKVLNNTKRFQKISNNKFELELDVLKGCSIKNLKYKNIDSPLIGTLEHGFFENIIYGVDFFSGHTVIYQLGKHKITDLSANKSQLITSNSNLSLESEFFSNKTKISKRITLKEDKITFFNKISLPSRDKQIIHPFHFTFLNDAWDVNSLYFKTHNGGSELETFYFNNKSFNHGDNLSFLISSKHGLGNTNGILIIGDNEKKIKFSLKSSLSCLIPTINFKIVEEDKFLLRLVYSAQEIDETFRNNEKSYTIFSEISITC